MATHNILGAKGESVAKSFLLSKNFDVLETNWRYQKLEVDIIAKKNNFIIFVEVKTRSTNYFGEPEEAVDLAKQKKLVEAANYYMQLVPYDAEARFDIISIINSKNDFHIKHIEDAFIPQLGQS